MVLSPPQLRAKTARALLGLAALSLATGCGGTPRPGISVTNAQSDVVFAGASATPTPAATTIPGTAGSRTVLAAGPAAAVPPVFTAPAVSSFTSRPFQFPQPGTDSGPRRSQICPGPPLGATAPTAATTSVQGQPQQGYYFWQALRSEAIANGVTSTTARYTNYQVTNVSPISTTSNPQGDPTQVFTFDVVSPMGKGIVITTTIQVKQNAPGANVSTGNVGKPARVSEPDAGVAIKKEVQTDATGKTVATFTPSTPVLILPLPVVGGASFTGTGSDPATGGSMQVSGTVKGPDRVTGCSDYVQGIRVDASVSSTAVPSQISPAENEVFTIETQGGAMVVGVAQTPNNSQVTELSVLGETKPTARPRDIPKDQAL